MKSSWRLYSWTALAALTGCAGPQTRYTAPNFQALAPPVVAVLPFDNWSTDLVGPGMLRSMLAARLKERGYNALSNDDVDARLRDIGITQGGQLAAVSPAQLAAALGADGLLYGTVEEFMLQDVGFVVRRVVKLHVKLLRAPGGDRLWEDTGEGNWTHVTFDQKEARRIFVEALVFKELENVARHPLQAESTHAIAQLISRLPQKR